MKTGSSNKLRVYTAAISHRFGITILVSRTEDLLYEKIANWCWEWWDEVDRRDIHSFTSDRAIVDEYFNPEMNLDESISFDSDEI